jgi:MFS family permease
VSPYVPVRDRPIAAPSPERVRRVSGTVFLLGLTSLFTDLASEMVAAVLPLFLTFQLGFSALQFGVIDGLYQGATAMVRVAGGIGADRRGRHKEIATAGYAVSALCKIALVAGTAWSWITAVLLVDRLGKGLRSSPRDAMISLSSQRATLAESFGVHRTLDTVGALLGPIAAFVVLSQLVDQYDVVFVIAFCVAVVGLAVIALFVRNPALVPTPEPRPLLADVRPLLTARGPFRSLVVAAGALALLTVSEPFVYLAIQDGTDMGVRWFPLLFAGTALSFLALAVPMGRLADRVGRHRVFLGGFGFLVTAYALLRFTTPGTMTVVAVLVLLGAFAAATDGVLMAIASTLLPAEIRTTGIAVLTSVTALARFISSVLFGALWYWWGWPTALTAFLVGMVVMLPLAIIVLRDETAAERPRA